MSLYSIDTLIEKLNKRDITLKEILSIRNKLSKPFKKHPLGFYACTLFDEGLEKIRLHYWLTAENQEIQSENLMIHDHTFNFKSWVLLGAIENIEYEYSSDGLAYNLYSTFYNQNTSILRRENRKVLVTDSNVKVISRDNSYEMSAGVLHKTKALEDLTFTVLYTKETNLKNPVVLADEQLTATEIFFERNEVAEKDMQKYLEHLKL